MKFYLGIITGLIIYAIIGLLGLYLLKICWVGYNIASLDKSYTIQIPKEEQKIKFLAMQRDKEGNIISSPVQPKLEMESKTFESQAVLKKIKMSKFQEEGYKIAAQEDKKDETKEAQAFYRRERNAACFVFLPLVR